MTLTLNDLRLGDCFRFTCDDAPDFNPTYLDTQMHTHAPEDLPPGWDCVDVDNLKRNNTEQHRHKAVEILEHYSREPKGVRLTRGLIRIGECFEYATEDAYPEKLLMVDTNDNFWNKKALPPGWHVARFDRDSVNHRPVRRVPHWDHVGEWNGVPPSEVPAKPTIGAPLQQLLSQTVNELTGEECLRRLELGMRNESLARPWKGSPDMVSTFSEGLDHKQFAFAQKLWSMKLAELQANARALEKTREVSIVVDGDFELEPWSPK